MVEVTDLWCSMTGGSIEWQASSVNVWLPETRVPMLFRPPFSEHSSCVGGTLAGIVTTIVTSYTSLSP